ncbi:hypothetical protein HZI73_14065 [Vallitalea pronyensis]|uniref:Mpv17 / PMP22 family protein n=1 Tax=Vallitalea pronyensis TaxID=1348613 RepID=A0A8J8MKU5_9FIRM|nr:hypothetical protein [Vallitalea pronyensis]QUI23344.1 hypothetical protein HZI73_14065 [Vallitalea pronyensis]
MKKGDFLWGAVLVLVIGYIVSPWTNASFIAQTTAHPYISGFIKFAVLSTMGELLTLRLNKKQWQLPAGFIWRIIIWGFIGILITLIFQLFASGVQACMNMGYLPGGESKLAFAFFTSALMNIFFAPVFMAMHMLSDTYLDLRYGNPMHKPNYNLVLRNTNWNRYANFIVVKTIPFFWIPAHTITFMMPKAYRIVMAALLSIALGAILTFANRQSSKS